LGENVVKTDKCMGVSQVLWGASLGCPPPKSTPMISIVLRELLLASSLRSF